jgi:DNA-binding response OmpR family regulator
MARRAWRVLVVEDNRLLAATMCELLESCGIDPVGPALTVKEALRAIDTEPLDAAILDIQLVDETSFPVCRSLLERGIPFLFLTGSRKELVPADLHEALVLQKPCDPDVVVEALIKLFEGRTDSDARSQ